MKITHNKVGQNLSITDSALADNASKAKDAKSKKTNNATSASNTSSTSSASKVSDLPNTAEATSSKDSSRSSSKVDISQRAKDIQLAKKIALAAPDTNEEKIARLQKEIESGKYKVESKDIADKLVEDELNWMT